MGAEVSHLAGQGPYVFYGLFQRGAGSLRGGSAGALARKSGEFILGNLGNPRTDIHHFFPRDTRADFGHDRRPSFELHFDLDIDYPL